MLGQKVAFGEVNIPRGPAEEDARKDGNSSPLPRVLSFLLTLPSRITGEVWGLGATPRTTPMSSQSHSSVSPLYAP